MYPLLLHFYIIAIYIYYHIFQSWQLSLWPTCQAFSTTLGRWSRGVPWHPLVGRGNGWFLATPGPFRIFGWALSSLETHLDAHGSWLFPIRNVLSNGEYFTVMLVFTWTGLVWQLVNLSLCTFPKKVPFCCLEMWNSSWKRYLEEWSKEFRKCDFGSFLKNEHMTYMSQVDMIDMKIWQGLITLKSAWLTDFL